MGANLLLAYIPAATITKQRRRVLHRLVEDLTDAELNNDEIVSLSDERDARQMLHEHVDLLPVNSELHRDVAEFALPHMPYRVLFTGGSSWGESPCDLFDSFCCLGALPKILRQLRDWALADEQLQRSRTRPRTLRLSRGQSSHSNVHTPPSREPYAVPRYRVEALEKFIVRTVYEVTARSPKQAERLCRSGRVGYDNPKIEEGDEEWIETVSVSEQR